MKNKEFIKNILMFLVIFSFLVFFTSFLKTSVITPEKEISFSKLIQDINEQPEKVKKITVSGSDISVSYLDGSKAKTKKELDTSLSQSFYNYGVDKEKLKKIEIENKEPTNISMWLAPLLYGILPLVLFILFFWFLLKQAKGGANQIFDFTRAKIKLLGKDNKLKERITFKDIAGLKEAKQELMEIVDFLKNPQKYLRLGAKIPRGVILIGPPGTGKTMLAKAVANESNVPFLSIAGSEFIELFVGVGSARIRSLFLQARKLKKAIIFIDEIDSIGKIRGVGVTGGHEEREQTLNQLLSEMDGIERDEGIIVMGATNAPSHLDPALLRPGRFDRRIVLDLPDVKEREEILKIHCRDKPLANDVNLKELAERTVGFSGADLANLANEAAILAAREEKSQVFQKDLLESIEKVLLGPERKSHIVSLKEKEIIAYHESGHALVSSFCPNATPVRKISIISRGLAGGYTLTAPKEERKIRTKSEFLDEITVLLGGYCAEKIKFNDITSGAANDLEQATKLARILVKNFGMSSLGPVSFGEKIGSPFLGEFEEYRNYSEKVATQIDEEIKKIITGCQKKAEAILTKRKNLLEKISQVLIQKETLEKEEYESLIREKNEKSTKKDQEKKEFSKSVKMKIKKI